MDPFDTLPVELIQQIIISTGDFAGVESILIVSSRVKAVFQAQPAILQDLILSNSITCMPEIHQLCYNIGLLNTPSLHCPDLARYQETCNTTPSLSYTKSLYIIQIGAQIQRLACTCLSIMQQNLISTLNNIPAGSVTGPLNIQKASTPFSWLEEYRLYWALWNLRHYTYLRKAATERWSWDTSLLQELDAYNNWNDIRYKQAEKLWTVAAVLSDIGFTVNWLPNDPEAEEPPRTVWPDPERTQIPYIPSFDIPPAHSQGGRRILVWTPPAPPPENEATTTWSLTPERRGKHHPQRHVVIFFHTSAARMRNCHPPCYILAKIKPWRRFGWVIWDSWRMYSVGLSDRYPHRDILTPDGEILKAEPRDPRERKPGVDYVARWFAMIGETLP